MFYTMQELMAQIKGWEYIIAILFLALFIGYWRLLGYESKRRGQRQPGRIWSSLFQGRSPARGRATGRLNLAPLTAPCWEARHCPPEVMASCSAYSLSPLPCWMARPLVSGERHQACTTCPIYTEGMERLIAAARKGKAGPLQPTWEGGNR